MYENHKNISNKALKLYLKEIERFSDLVLTPEQEKGLFKRLKKGDNVARKEITNAYLKLVIRIAEYYLPKTKNLTLLDLIGEGNSGLSKAVERYNLKNDYAFSIFATLMIGYAITKSLLDENKILRIESAIEEGFEKMKIYKKKIKPLQKKNEPIPKERKIIFKGIVKAPPPSFHYKPTIGYFDERTKTWVLEEMREVTEKEKEEMQLQIKIDIGKNLPEMIELLSKIEHISKPEAEKELKKIIQEK